MKAIASFWQIYQLIMQSYKIKSVRQKPMKVISSDHTPRESETVEGEGLVTL